MGEMPNGLLTVARGSHVQRVPSRVEILCQCHAEAQFAAGGRTRVSKKKMWGEGAFEGGRCCRVHDADALQHEEREE